MTHKEVWKTWQGKLLVLMVTALVAMAAGSLLQGCGGSSGPDVPRAASPDDIAVNIRATVGDTLSGPQFLSHALVTPAQITAVNVTISRRTLASGRCYPPTRKSKTSCRSSN